MLLPFLNTNLIIGAAVGVVALLTIYLISALKTPKVNYRCKHVLVTGGSQGIGFEVAKEYIKRGANVTIVARKPEEAVVELKRFCVSDAQSVQCVAVDISAGLEAVQAAFDPILRAVGDVHTIVNSAGISEAR